MKYPAIKYDDYLQISDLLECQSPKSTEYGKPAHEEMLFIVVHQAFELWFKQILHDLDSLIKILDQKEIPETDMGTIVHRLKRVTEIQKLMMVQFDVLETMTPLDFLDFRDCIIPASGFQSFQFRLIENKMGLDPESRLTYNNSSYLAPFTPDEQQKLKDSTEKTVLKLVEAWLERTPFLDTKEFDFWQSYKVAVEEMNRSDLEIITENEMLSDADKERNKKILEASQSHFSSLFDDNNSGQWNMSLKALRAALIIQLYRDQPVFQKPFQLLTTLIDIDENFTHWRQKHALLAKRMLGTKIGTGGSSGHEYLKQSADHHKIFEDLFRLTTFFIPRSHLPELPKKMKDQLRFFYESK